MIKKQSKITMNADRWSYLWLAIGAILYVVGNGRWIIPLATWLWPIFILRFMRTQKPSRGLLIAAVVFIAGYIISWQGALKTPLFMYIIMAVILGIVTLLPFLVDRLIAPRFQGILSTLVFPLAWITMEYVKSLGSYATWGSLAYTQYGNLPLMQIVSVTGIWGLGFLITWFASVVNLAWEHKFTWQKMRGVVGLYACILALVFLFGGARLAFFPPVSKTVRVASITTPGIQSQFMEYMESKKLPPLEKTIEVMEKFSVQAARAGAKIAFWQEYGALVAKDDEEAFIDRGSKLAFQEKIYLMLGMGVFSPDPDVRGENKVVLIDPSGKVIWKYLKRYLVPGIESPYMLQGEGKIPALDTPFGKIASVICFDLDFTSFIRQAGKGGVDLLLGPSLDWREITPLHTQMTTFRSIENGFSMIRCTGEGLSIAVDCQGRTLAVANYFTTDEPVMISDVPSQGVTTIYSKIGDLFAWLCCAGFVVVLYLALFQRKSDGPR